MRTLTTTAFILAAGLLLTGCQQGTSDPGVTPSPTSSAASGSSAPSPSPKPTVAPVLIPEGSAKQNLPYFNAVIQQAIAADPTMDSSGIAAVLSQNGFPAESIQFTFTRTAVGLASDSVDIAALWAGECLIAQFGPAIPQYHSVILPALATGGCLIGAQVQGL